MLELLDFNMPVNCISRILGVSDSTITRRMREFGVSARQHYSNDQELDDAVQQIKAKMPMQDIGLSKGGLSLSSKTLDYPSGPHETYLHNIQSNM